MFIPNNDVKIVCKLEKDDGNTFNIEENGTSRRYDKVKKIAISEVCAIDSSIFSPHIYYISNMGRSESLCSIECGSLSPGHQCFHGIGGLFTAKNDVFIHSNSGITIKPHEILTTDGKPIDATQYTGDKKLELVQGKSISTVNYVVDLYNYDSKTSTRSDKVGTLPSKFLGILNNQVKLISYEGSNILKSSDLDGYFTLKYKDGGVVGYFSDKNGSKDAVLDDEFKIDMDFLSFLSSVKIEELAQKTLELEESYHSAALNSTQVKGKAISTVVNKVKRQVEEDATFKDDIKDLLKDDQLFKRSLDANPSEIVNRLVHNTRFKRAVKGEFGPEGEKGDTGAVGPTGSKGARGTNAQEVATELVTNKKDALGEAVLRVGKYARGYAGPSTLSMDLASNADLQRDVRDLLRNDQVLKNNLKHALSRYLASNADLQRDVKDLLRNDRNFKNNLKGDTGSPGNPGQDANPAEIVSRLKHDTRFKRAVKGEFGPEGEKGDTGAAGRNGISPTSNEVATKLKADQVFKTSVKGDKGDQGPKGADGTPGIKGDTGFKGDTGSQGIQGSVGPQGAQGPKGTDGTSGIKGDTGLKGDKGDQGQKGSVGPQGAQGPKGTDGTHGIKGDTGLKGDKGDPGQKGADGTPGLKGADGTHGIKGDTGERGERGPKGDPGIDGRDAVMNLNPLKIKIKQTEAAIEKVEEEIQDIDQRISQTASYVNTPQEKKDQLKIVQSNDDSTNVKIEGKGVIAKFSKVGYYFHNGQLHIHNPETQIDVAIPSEFNFLKVVEHSEKPTNYMLVLVNQLGNELFEHKKYDFTFSSLANEFKFIDSQQVKTSSKINFNNGLYFILKPGDVELSNSQNYAVDVYEIGSNKKIGTLIDEFCYYQDDQLHYVNYHTGKEPHNCSYKHNLSIEQNGDYQAKINIMCEEGNTSKKVASDVHPIVISEFGLLEYLADHSLV